MWLVGLPLDMAFSHIEMNLFSSRQEGGELANDVISPPHPGHQLPVPALSVGGA